MKNKPFDLPVEVIASGTKRLVSQLIRSHAFVEVMNKLKVLGISNDEDTDHIVMVNIVIPNISKSKRPVFGNYYKYTSVVSVEIEITQLF